MPFEFARDFRFQFRVSIYKGTQLYIRVKSYCHLKFLGSSDFNFKRLDIVRDAILPRKGPVTRAMSKRLQEDWARAAEEGPRVLMNLRVDF